MLLIINQSQVIFFSAFLLISVVYVYIRVKFSGIFTIKVKTIRRQPPVIIDSCCKEKLSGSNGKYEKLIRYEQILRKLAYKNTLIKTNDSFFNDSDMKSEYHLIVVYDKKNDLPLLSARYYFDNSVIARYLQGDKHASNQNQQSDRLYFNTGRKIFLIDRLSGNINNSVYRKYRNYIHLLFYSEVLFYNKDSTLFLMARREKKEKLLTKYIRLGFNVVDSTVHNGKEHWILSGDMNKSYTMLKSYVFFNLVFIIRNYLLKSTDK